MTCSARRSLIFPEHRGSPFDVYLEATMPIVQLHQRYSARIMQANTELELQDTLTALAVEIVARLWRIDPDTTVSEAEMAAHGFDTGLGTKP